MLLYLYNLTKQPVMNLRYLRIIIVSFFALYSLVSSPLQAHERGGYGAPFERLNRLSGLSHNGSTCMLHDSRGYLWVGTYDGLNRYNGTNITTYKNEVGRTLFLSSRIYALAEDCNGNIWVGTEMGVTLFDVDKELFRPLSWNEDQDAVYPFIRYINICGDRVFCFSENNGVVVYDLSGEIVEQGRIDERHAIQSVLFCGEGRYILASHTGLLYYNTSKHELKRVWELPYNSARLLVRDGDSDNYVVAYYEGVQRLRLTFTANGCKGELLGDIDYPNSRVRALDIDAEGTLWLGVDYSGVYYLPNYIENMGRRLRIQDSPRRPSAFLSDDYCFWISSFDDGVWSYSLRRSPFSSIGDNHMGQAQILPYKENKIFVKERNKLHLFNFDTKRYERLPFDVSYIENRPKVICQGMDGDIYFVLSGKDGLCELARVDGDRLSVVRSEKLRAIQSKVKYANQPVVATCDGAGALWIGYLNNLYRVVLGGGGLEVESVESIYENSLFDEGVLLSHTRNIYCDRQTNSLFVCGDKSGLVHIKLEDGKRMEELKISQYRYDLDDPHSITSNYTTSAIRLGDGSLWVGTEGGGLCRVEQSGDTLSFEAISEEDGLSNNVVKSLIQDRSGNLWIGTNIGLNLYDREHDVLKSYHVEDGLYEDNFWYNTTLLDDGMVVAACANSICYFYPEKIEFDEPTPKLYFDELRIYNSVVKPNVADDDGRVMLTHRLKSGDVLHLNHDQNVFAIDVDAIYGDAAKHSVISYMLSPVNGEWICITSPNRTLHFNGLTPGEYTLRVKTSTSQGAQSDELLLSIVISPPFWRTTTAYILYFILIVIVIALCFYVVLRYQSLMHNLQIETIEKSAKEDKIRYLSNISHELKTPLSLIVAPLSELKERFRVDVDVNKRLDIIRRQSRKMLELVDLIHGLEVDDLKNLTMVRSNFSFSSLVEQIGVDFKFMAQHDNKQFEVVAPEQQIFVEADRAMIEKIFNNLLTNAFKYTRHGDTIKLSFWIEEQNMLHIQVFDSGYGIDEKDLPHIFDRFYQATRSGSGKIGGTGIGLTFTKRLVELHQGEINVQSKVGVGTTFTLALPVVSSVAVTRCAEDEGGVEESMPDIIGGDEDLSHIVVTGEFASSLVYYVDDNQELRLYLSEILGRYFKVSVFANGADLFAALEHNSPDIILSDVMMPEMDGYELCCKIKGDINTSHIPIILLTACSAVDDKIKGLEYGADAYIAKPFYPKHVITRVETLLRSRQRLRERYSIGTTLTYGEDSSISTKDNEFIVRLQEIFEANLDNDELNLDDVAKELCQNRSLFFKKVKSITNSSPYELLKEYRLKRAAELLGSTHYNVGEVCSMTGFKDRSHFSRLFKDRYNVSPSKYQNNKNS
ncbi:MAG: ATP-binding protein [Rikenellaceae bacterium]